MNRLFLDTAGYCCRRQPGVLVAVAHTAGSAPREPGARLTVTPTQVLGTICGGNLEFAAVRIDRARRAIRNRPDATSGSVNYFIAFVKMAH